METIIQQKDNSLQALDARLEKLKIAGELSDLQNLRHALSESRSSSFYKDLTDAQCVEPLANLKGLIAFAEVVEAERKRKEKDERLQAKLKQQAESPKEVFDYKKNLVAKATGPQLHQLCLDFEPTKLYQPEKLSIPGRFALCHTPSGSDRLIQEIFDVSKLDWVISQIQRMPDYEKMNFWISQATLAPWARNRQICSIVLLNAIWVDIDIAHPPESGRHAFDKSKMPTGTYEQMAQMLAFEIEEAGLPAASYIIATGGGLCAKWVFDTSLPSSARARWQSVQKHLIDKIGSFESWGKKWPVDYNASDAARILRLVNTHNPRWNQSCRIVFDSGKRHDFELLAECLLPYSRKQLKEFAAARSKYKIWDKNRTKAAEIGIRRSTNANAVESLMSDEIARSLWNARFEFGRAILQHRGGATPGSRNNIFWPMANAVAYSCTKADSLTKELSSLHSQFFRHDGWTQAEAMQASASVKTRMATGNLYKMKTATFLESMEVTQAEKEAFGHLLGTSRHNANATNWNKGSMQFEPIKGLSFKEFVKETKSRQAEAGKAVGSKNLPTVPKGQDVRAKAILMRNSGLKQVQIAKELGVSQGSISNWLRAAKAS